MINGPANADESNEMVCVIKAGDHPRPPTLFLLCNSMDPASGHGIPPKNVIEVGIRLEL
jgi:hypothetical protein